VIQEIEKHEGKVSSVLARHEKLRSIAGVYAPTEGTKLVGEITSMKREAYKQKDRLKELMDEQKKHEDEVRLMQDRIDMAQGMVEESKQRSESVDGMKKKVTEANVRITSMWKLITLLYSYCLCNVVGCLLPCCF